jgi:hypothetical protein
MTRIRLALAAAMALVVASCADLKVQVQYAPDAKIEKLSAGVPVTVFRFADARGDEGDRGDVYRVGGVYGGYGNRLSKVLATSPWPTTLTHAVSEGLKARGMEVVSVADRPLDPAALAVSTPLALGGEIRNFSTESRWTRSAHVSGILRLYSQNGRLLLERPISARATEHELGTGVFTSVEPLEALMNQALTEFVRKVVMDPDLTQRLVAAH